MRINIAEPFFGGNEKKYLNECIDTGWLSSNGKFVNMFEEKFKEFCGVDYALACANGTVSLHLALEALGLSNGDEVIMPTFTYIATANCVTYCGAKPVFVDSKRDTLNIDPSKIEEKITDKTKAIIVVHLYGNVCDMDEIMRIAKKHDLYVIEDAAESHGATYKGKKVGSIGHIGSFSFFGNKIITTGEGGMLTFNDEKLYNKAKMLRGQGMDPNRRYWHSEVGFNYRMTNMQAAVGLAQLEKIEWHIDKHKKINDMYIDKLSKYNEYFSFQQTEKESNSVCWMFCLMLNKSVRITRDQLMIELDKEGIETRPFFYPMHIMPPYLQDDAYEVAEEVAANGMNLPTFSTLEEDKIDYIVTKLMEIVKSNEKK